MPGSRGDLLQLKSQGSDVRIVYSPLDAVNLAAANPDRKVVFFAIGFETTAPANAMAVWLARKRAADEFQRAGLARAGAAGDDGHPAKRRTTACRASSGPATSAPSWAAREYEPIAARLSACRSSSPASSRSTCSKASCATVRQLEAGRAEVENQYARAVRREGNPASQRLIDDVFEVCDRKWRGIGLIPQSGYRLRPEYRDHDAERLFEVDDIETAGIVRLHQRPDPARA